MLTITTLFAVATIVCDVVAAEDFVRVPLFKRGPRTDATHPEPLIGRYLGGPKSDIPLINFMDTQVGWMIQIADLFLLLPLFAVDRHVTHHMLDPRRLCTQ
jgi:hypothetical protein